MTFPAKYRSSMYNVFRWLGFSAIASLRKTHGPGPDLAERGRGFDRVRNALSIGVYDQTFGVEIGDEPTHNLLIAWRYPYGQLDPDEALELCARVLTGVGWHPSDGPEEAQRVFDMWERHHVRKFPCRPFGQ